VKYFFITFLLFGALYLNVSAQVDNAPEDIKRFISTEEKGQQVPVEINKLIHGDVGGDAKKDIVIQYIVQVGYPGNSFISYLAVFLNQKGHYNFIMRMDDGGKLGNVLVPRSIKNKVIYFDKFAPQGFDKVGTVKYKLVGRKLVKVK
jgi:hypothetical protein